jgi:hypothetical protein
MPPYEVVKLGLRLTCGGGQEKHSLQALEALPSFEQRDVGGLLVNFYNNPARPWLCNFDVFDVVGQKCVVPEGIGACKCSYIFPGGIAEMVAHRVLYGYTNDLFIFGANNEYEVLNNNAAHKVAFDLDAKGGAIIALKGLYPDDWEKLVTDGDAFLSVTIPVITRFVNSLISKRNSHGGESLPLVSAADLMVCTSSKPYDPTRRDDILLKGGLLSFHVAIPTLYIANFAHRLLFSEELRAFADAKDLDGVVDLGVYTSNRKMRSPGASKIGGRPMIPLSGYTDTTTGERVSFASKDGDGQDWWDLSVPTICDHAWTFVDPDTSHSVFHEEQVAERRQRQPATRPTRSTTNPSESLRRLQPHAGALLSTIGIAMLEVFKSFCVRHNSPFDSNDFRIVEAPGSANDFPTLQFCFKASDKSRWCPVARMHHDSNTFKLVCTENGRGVFYLCLGRARGDASALPCCTASGEPSATKTNYVRNLNGADNHCCGHYVGSLPQPVFEVRADLELDAVDIGGGKLRIAPISSALLFGRATELLRERGELRESTCGVVILRVNMCGGKSFAMYHWLARRARKDPKLRFVFAVPKKALVVSVYNALKARFEEEGLPNYWKCQYPKKPNGKLDTDKLDPTIRWHADSIVCCTQSLPRLNLPDSIDVFICDEVCDVVTQASSFARASGVLPALIGTIKLAKKVILSDGFADKDIVKLCGFAGRPTVIFDCSEIRPFDAVQVRTFVPLSPANQLCPAYAFEHVIKRMKDDLSLYVHAVVTTLADMDVLEARARRDSISVALIYGDQRSEDKETALQLFEQPIPTNDTPRLTITTPALQGGVSNYFCRLVVTFLRAWTVSSYSIKQAESRARGNVELERIIMDPRLITSRAHRTEYASERYFNYGLLDDATKEQVDAQTWPTTLADLKIQAAKEGLGIPLELPLRNIARPCDYVFMPTKKAGVYERIFIGAPSPLATEDDVDNDRTRSDRVLQSLRMTPDAAVSDIYAQSRDIHVDYAPPYHACFSRSLMLEAKNRTATMLDSLALADKRLGIKGAMDPPSFMVLDDETLAQLKRELQTTLLLTETRRLLTGVSFYHELYAETVDAAAREAALVLQLRSEKANGASSTNKRKQVSLKPSRGGGLAEIADLVSKYDSLLKPRDLAADTDDDSRDADLASQPGVLDSDSEAEVLASLVGDKEREAMAKLLGIAVTTFTKATVDTVANGLSQAAANYESVISGGDATERSKAGAQLRKANAVWVSLFDDNQQLVFRALTLLNELRADHGEAKDGTGAYIHVIRFREYVKNQAQRGGGMPKGSENLLDLVAADELLRVVGFNHGLFTDPSDAVGPIIDDPRATRYETQHSRDVVDAETARTTAIKAMCKKLDDKPRPNYDQNLGLSVRRILKLRTKVFTWGLRAVNGEHDVGIVHSDKRWRIAPSPMVAWCGAHTHGVNEAWSTLWAKVRNLADDGGGRDEIADE